MGDNLLSDALRTASGKKKIENLNEHLWFFRKSENNLY